eukprot:Skav223393  [mRNA]  locus=scaffold2634:520153:524052:- [translate_table: standard]
MAASRLAASAVKGWQCGKVVESTAEQWKHYLDLCGTWHGTWKRFAPSTAQSLRPQEQFQAVCAPCVAADGQSVQHVNRYPPNVAPKPGRLADGLTEDRQIKGDYQAAEGAAGRILAPAAYGPGWAVMWPSTPQPERIAVELISRVGEERHRLVAMWRGQAGSCQLPAAVATAVLAVLVGLAWQAAEKDELQGIIAHISAGKLSSIQIPSDS